ncbi:GNAT family N-acetyltransferase [Paenibacillus sp. CF384]|uniref:GNAT family N-acetyltransferase n=1 Tax=Paenibacillus sp. CF384 TaxID=1884382 RepID=UPI0008984169|nr:GNAT family N-acetyltransferase [Paenibacillus sp. CF384]SDW19575.1 Predicted acetyltransferase [Paenibacillus sp. CF384]
MNIEVMVLPYQDKTLLYQLIQLYRYDSSEFDGHVLNEHGFYLYKYFDHQWTDDYRRPYLIRVDGEIAGFALVSLDVPPEYMKLSTAERTHTIGDFFIMRKYRRIGVGRVAAQFIMEQHRGFWEIRQTAANTYAHSFWKQVISDYVGEGNYQEKLIQTDQWNGPVFVFRSE